MANLQFIIDELNDIDEYLSVVTDPKEIQQLEDRQAELEALLPASPHS